MKTDMEDMGWPFSGMRDDWDEYLSNPPEFPELDSDTPEGGVHGPEFAPIEPPKDLWEWVIESIMGFAARVGEIDIPETLTATQAVVEYVFGKPKSAAESANTISEAVQLGGEKGILNRPLRGDSALARGARWMRDRKEDKEEEGDKKGGAIRTLVTMRALGRVAGMVARALGPVGVGLAVVTGAAIAAGVVLNKMSHLGWEQINAVAKYNGTLLAAQKRIEVGNILRDIDMAHQLAGPGSEHMAQQERLNKALHPWKVQFNKMKTRLGGWATGVMADVVENPVGALADILPDLMLEKVGLGADWDDEFVAYGKQVGKDLWANPVGAMATHGVDAMFPDRLLELVGLGAEADDELVKEVRGMFTWVKEQFGADKPEKIDPLEMHNMIIGPAFGGPPPPLQGLGAAPPP